MRQFLFASIAACTLAACGQPPAVQETDPEAAAQIGEAQSLDRSALPPATQAPRFVGLWGASADTCAETAWTIRADGLTTPGEVACSFDQVSEIPAGYDIQATCTAQGPAETQRMQFTFAESAQALLIAGGPWSSPTALVHCGPLP
ncbi:MAG: hypothetical protein AB7P07_01135 [Hyphomonadaceae bacterium]